MNEELKNLDFYSNEDYIKKYSHIKSNLIFGNFAQPVPKYTISILTYKRPFLLKQALTSAINQTNFKDYEIIVLDHDNTYNTAINE